VPPARRVRRGKPRLYGWKIGAQEEVA
jgi:hypothetical protein